MTLADYLTAYVLLLIVVLSWFYCIKQVSWRDDDDERPDEWPHGRMRW